MDIKQEIIKLRDLPDNFFNPSINDVGEITLLKNIDKAKEVLIRNINENNKITIFADIDIDGVMATSIMYNWLDGIFYDNKKVLFQQRTKGHGIKFDIVKETDLLIIVDSSSNESEEISKILYQNKVKEIIIIDHHEVDGLEIKGGTGNILLKFAPYVEINDRVTLLNPHQLDCKFKNKDISGAMLTYRFLEYVSQEDEQWQDKIERLSDLPAISIISDVMRVDNMENRYYYYNGLNSIQNNGLFSFMDTNRINTFNVNSNKLAFEINPKINATIRMQSIKMIFELFLQTDKVANDRKDIIKKINKAYELKGKIEEEIRNKMTILFENDNIIILQNNYIDRYGVSSNFNGVLASQVANEKQKHTIIVNSLLKGSGRAYSSYELKGYLDEICKGSVSCAGHQGAFGIKINNLKNFIDIISNTPPPVDKTLPTDFEIEIEFKELSKNIFEEIEEIQFMVGNGFPNIRFKVNNIVIKEIKETSGGNLYYLDDRKKYIRIMNKTNLLFDELDSIDIYGTLSIKEYFGKIYYEIECINIENN